MLIFKIGSGGIGLRRLVKCGGLPGLGIIVFPQGGEVEKCKHAVVYNCN